MEYEITEYPEQGIAEIHILEWRPTHNSYYDLLLDFEVAKQSLAERHIHTLITYAEDVKYRKLWKMFGFEDMGIEPITGGYWGKLEVRSDG